MNPNDARHAAAHLLFAGAVDQSAEERDRFLADACGQDSTLRLQVAGALGAMQEESDDFDASAMPTILSAPTTAVAGTTVLGANPDSSVPLVFGRRIAKGGMGAILEGDDCKLGRKIAVKVMLTAGADGDLARRFVQEAAVLGRLQHPNIVPIHDLGRDARGQLYYTMKLVKGRTLQNILNDLRDQDPATMREHTLASLLTVFHKVCDALAFAHSQGVLHRDLKPENVMVGEFGEVLVMDWGLAKIQDKEIGRQGEGESSIETRVIRIHQGQSSA